MYAVTHVPTHKFLRGESGRPIRDVRSPTYLPAIG